MADQLKKSLESQGPRKRVFDVSFATAGSGAPTVDDTRSQVVVTRSATGRFQLALPVKGKSMTVVISQGSTTAQLAILRSKSASTGIVEISTVTAGGTTEADTTGRLVDVIIILRLDS